jgi:hypothetical protein
VDEFARIFFDDANVMSRGIKRSHAGEELSFRYGNAAPTLHQIFEVCASKNERKGFHIT